MSLDKETLKRVRRKHKGPQNPLFEQWLIEWKQDAVKSGSEMQYCFGKALRSLQKYPFRLYSGKECLILENFGVKLCQMLDKRLEEYKATNSDDPIFQNKSITQQPNLQEKKMQESNSGIIVNTKKRKNVISSPKIKNKVPKQDDKQLPKEKSVSNFIPAFRSGSYAILLTLFNESSNNEAKGSMTKSELQEAAQELCDNSFTKPQPGSYYTAWSSMSSLIKKELVIKKGNPPKFSLTEKGMDKAIQLKFYSYQEEKEKHETVESLHAEKEDSLGSRVVSPDKSNNLRETILKENANKKLSRPRVAELLGAIETQNEENNVFQPSSKNNEESHSAISESNETVFLLPGTFDIILLVDIQETDNKLKQNNATVRQLKSKNVNFEVRHLKVGDFVWICKDRIHGYELILPYVVERKRLDDFGSSIKDGRFHEQKFRLKQCGLKNLIYLVEKYGNENQRLGLPLPTIQQAAANTQIVDGFTVKVTNNHDESMRYLSCMTLQLQNIFKDKTLVSCGKKDLPPFIIEDDLASLMKFSEFNKGSGKIRKYTVRDMLIKHLVQIKGLSVEKAMAIVQLYSTPCTLIHALKNDEVEKKLANITYGGLSRSLGPVVAKTIHQLYTLNVLQ